MRCAERVEQGVHVNVIWYSGCGGRVEAGLCEDIGDAVARSVRGLPGRDLAWGVVEKYAGEIRKGAGDARIVLEGACRSIEFVSREKLRIAVTGDGLNDIVSMNMF